MSAAVPLPVEAAPPPATDLPTRLALELGGAVGAWSPCWDRWSPALAERWRAVLVRSAVGELALLCARASDALLHERVESELDACVAWVRGDEALIDALLADGALQFRALDGLDARFDASADTPAAQELSAARLEQEASPVVRLLESTLHDALQDGASDVHFECTARGLVVRSRVDGVMALVRDIDGALVAEQLVSRLKVMAELDIGERRLPQDGRFRLRVRGRDVDFRLSIMPTVHGEDAVVRILDRARMQPAAGGLTLDALGFDAAACAGIRRLARLPHGMLLVTGPTGSGKTTTLYAAISEVNRGDDKIITIEDPVEYALSGVVQIPVNERKGLGFARGLRSVLRHDPDRVMVGEIRDAETAQIAVQAALTGHLVFSTVHANSAFDVVGRFMHMGLDLYHVVAALNGIVAQRLLRLNCAQCCVAAIAPRALLDPAGAAPHHLYTRGSGCAHCRHTGYHGRRAIAELLLFDDELRDLVASRAPMGRIKQAARERGFASLREVALGVARAGHTSLEEVDRVTIAE